MKSKLLLLLLLPLFSYSQTDTLLIYTDIVTVENVSKDQLFTRARAWLVDAFKDSKEVIQVQDKETGELIAKGIMKSDVPYKNFMGTTVVPCYTSFKFSIWVKDGKYKYEMTDFNNTEFKGSVPFGLLYTKRTTELKWPMISKSKMNEYYGKYRDEVEKTTKLLIEFLHTAMSVKPKSDF